MALTDLAARIVAEAAGGDIAEAGWRIAFQQWHDDRAARMPRDVWQARFDAVKAATQQLLDQRTA